MTSHRLIHTTVDRVVCVTAASQPQARVEDHRQGRLARVHWHTRHGVHSLAWTLEVQQGANGVLAHLTAEASAGPLLRLTSRWRRIALQPVSRRRLTQLADLASRWDRAAA